MLTTRPGFSFRSTEQHTKQLPQRDGADMSNMTDEAGWSNSEPVEDAPQDNYPDVEPLEELEPGFSNGRAVVAEDAPAEEPSAAASDDADSSDEKPAKKAAAKKSAARKKG